ncbi:MAG TPA: hypothetical protein PKX91_03750 [Clostridia bacterium]|jgi:hypothetical protein|nr:hypothetical protein [Clostridia bacterium]
MERKNEMNLAGKGIDWSRIKLLLIIGIIGTLINLAGDMLVGWGVKDTSLSGIEGQISHYLKVSDGRLFASVILGLIGVPLSGVGHIGIYKLIRPYSKKYARLQGVGIFGCFTFGGSGVHASSLAAAFFYKYMTAVSPETALASSIKFAFYFMLPLYIALFTCMIISTCAQIIAYAKGYSPFPRWGWVFTLPIGAALASIVNVFGNYAIVNAIGMAAATFGNIWTISGALIMLGIARKRCLSASQVS